MRPAERHPLLRPALLLAGAVGLVAASPRWERLAASCAIAGFFGYLVCRLIGSLRRVLES